MFFPPPHVSSKLSWTMSELLRVEFKWHVGNKNTSNFNTISLAIWFGKARKIGYLKSVRIALQPCWEQWKKKKTEYTLLKRWALQVDVGLWCGQGLGHCQGPLQDANCSGGVRGQRFWEKARHCFLTTVLNPAVIPECFWITPVRGSHRRDGGQWPRVAGRCGVAREPLLCPFYLT